MAKRGDFDPSKTGEQSISGTSREEAKLEIARDIVSRAAPYLEMTESGHLIATKDLSAKSREIQRVLYDIPPSNGAEDYAKRVKPHHKFIDETVWIPVLGKKLIASVREHFQEQGIHCDPPEILKKESKFFADCIRCGDTGRLHSFLLWNLKKDPEMIPKLMKAVE